ncbi:MAG: outer membrane beta-barrel protein [Bacteroidales bacterium]|nr:outer membrane beta-barrel protein [Bacteroidales bacterium]
MKKFISLLILTVCLCVSAKAQVFILNDNIFQGRMSEIRTTVLDSLTNEPVAFASVYVIPSKDTTITNFTLTDAKGEAKLEEVPFGNYAFHVEMMGYKPFVKERYFRDEVVEMGTIRLQVDEQFLQAATVTGVGNPIVMKKDTIEFNASSFRVGANAMLKDLLMRMPGMEITEDGKVKFNGEEIDKLTVGGRTFFFNDQSTALNNLPAAVVDKIRVIDRESEQTRASGLQDGTREKVLDVALKKEYEKGWFGNVSLKGGTTVGDKNPEELRDDRGLLYNGNVLVSAYNEKDQLTIIGATQNIDDSGIIFQIMDGDGEITSSLDQGLSSAAQLAFNVNTARIKDVETTVGANAKYTDTVSGTRAERTTYLDGGNLTSSSENKGRQFGNAATGNIELQKEKGKVWFHVRSQARFDRSDSFTENSTTTSREGVFVNSSDNTTRNLSVSKDAVVNSDISFRDLWGKEKRNLSLQAYASYGTEGGNSDQSSVLTLSDGKDFRTMRYDNDSKASWLDGTLKYTEPLSEKWLLAATTELSWNRRDAVRDAFDAAGRNDYYSSISRSSYLEQAYGLTAQYTFGTGSWITFGGEVVGVQNETFSKSFGVESVTGKDEWNWYVMPRVRFQHNKGNDRLTLSVSGYTQRPNLTRMQPVLNINNPSRLSLGNIYLRPYSETDFSASWTRNNREKFTNLSLNSYTDVYTSSISQAQWYDANGILYSIPVNSRKPRVDSRIYANYTTPLDAKKIWSLTLYGSANYFFSVSYLARTTLPGLDKDTFDYSDFMSEFWGNAKGDRFYGGESGFEESCMHTFSPNANISVKFNHERFSFTTGVSGSARFARYSLDPNANLNTLNIGFRGDASYTTKHEYELNTDLAYVIYKGYAPGYGQPEWQWNAEINKNIGAFNLSVSVHDILNQTRSLTHTVNANYEEDSYRLVMGRYVLFGVKWNFGKMNAAHSQRAQQVAWDMIY